MTRTLLLSFALFVFVLTGSPASGQELIHYWNFNDPEESGNPWPAPIAANTGDGEITYNFNSESSRIDDQDGSTINARSGDDSGQSFVVKLGGGSINNGRYFELSVSTAGFEGIKIRYAVRRTDSGFDQKTVDYSLDGGATFTEFNTFQESDYPAVDDYGLFELDFSSIDGADDNSDFRVRFTLDGATHFLGSNRFDNITVEGAPLPADDGPIENITQGTFYDTIQEAIDDADSGDIIEISDGTYQDGEGTLDVSQSVTLRGDSRDGVIIQPSSSSVCRGVDITADNATLEDITVDGTDVQDTGACGNNVAVVQVLGDNVTIDNVTVDAPGAGEAVGINLFDTDGATIENTLVQNTGKDGINVRSRNVTLKDLTLPNNAVNSPGFGAIAIYGSTSSGADPEASVTFEGTIDLDDNPNGLIVLASNGTIEITNDSPTFSFDNISGWPLADFGSTQTVSVDGGSLSAFAQSIGLPARVTFLGDPSSAALFEASSQEAAAKASVLPAPGPASAIGFNLDNGGFFVGQNSPSETMSIQTALDAASDADVVNILPGTYAENVTIDDALTLQGTTGGGTTSVVKAAPPGAPTINGTVTISSDDVTVDGLIIDGGSSVAIHTQPANVGYDNLTISNNTLRASDITPIVYIHGHFSGGVVNDPSTNVTVQNNLFDGSIVGGVALGLEASTGSSVTSNDFQTETEYGHVELFGPDIDVSDNTFDGSALDPDAFYVKDTFDTYDLFAVEDVNTFSLGPIVQGNKILPGQVADCPIPEVTEEDQQGMSLFVTFSSGGTGEGLTRVDFVDPDDNPALTNFEVVDAPPEFTSSDDIRWSAASGSEPETAIFELEAIPPSGETGEFEASYFAVLENTCGSTFDADPIHRLDRPAPEALALSGNYPNPFAAQTTIEVALPAPMEVTLTVYDVTGREVATLANGSMPAGTHHVRWDGRSASGAQLASGLYLVRLKAGDQIRTRRLTIVR